MAEKELTLTGVHTSAETYSFRVAEGFGWAICTVDDATGVLSIVSDWGNWANRWHASPRSLGAPTLTHFIADRDGVDYLARKLNGRNGRQFSAELTIAALRRLLADSRLVDGRLSHELGTSPYRLSRNKAREIWDELGELMGVDDSGLFWERACEIRGLQYYVDETPWEHEETEQTAEDRALRELVLPALIEACAARVAERETASADHVQAALDRGDDIGALCALVEAAGGTMRLHGKKITTEELRKRAEGLVDEKPEPARSKVDLATWTKSKVRGELREVLVSPDGEVVILGAPEQVEKEDEAHNCDTHGCGTDHVLWRGHVGRRLRRSEIQRVRAAAYRTAANRLSRPFSLDEVGSQEERTP